MPDTVFRGLLDSERNHALVRLSYETADEPTGIAPWRTLLCSWEVRSLSLLLDIFQAVCREPSVLTTNYL